MTRLEDGLYTALLRRGVSRRSFIKFSAAMAAALALPASYAPRIARAVATTPRLPVVWLRGQDCAGNTTAFLHASDPTVSELVLDLLSVDCHETAPLPPPEYPHPEDYRLGCRTCHQSAEVGNMPIDHALRKDETCLLCHDIKVASQGPATLPSPVVTPQPGG